MNVIYNPALLPKIRSRALLNGVRGMPCALRISSFIPGHRCAPDDTVVPCHVGKIGKGLSTKVSDLHIVAGCQHCHDLADGRDNRIHWIAERYPAALWERIASGMMETQSRLIMAGLIVVPNSEVI